MAEDDPSPEDILGGEAKPRALKAAEPRLHPILSNEEFHAAQSRAREKIDAERKRAAAADIEARETERLRKEEGLTTGVKENDELVNFTVDLPPFAPYIMINGPLGMTYHHGRTYLVPRHVANTLNEAQFRMWKHEDSIDGKGMDEHMRKSRNTTVNARTGAISQAPRAFDA